MKQDTQNTPDWAQVEEALRDQLKSGHAAQVLAHEIATLRQAGAELQAQAGALVQRAEVLAKFQRALDVSLPLAGQLRPRRSNLVVEANAPVSADCGLHALERDGNGLAFRWSGPQPYFRFDLALDRRRPLWVGLHVASWGRERALGLKLLVDGREVPVTGEVGGRAWVCSAVLNADGERPVTRLWFKVAQMHATESSGSDAARRVGVPVQRLMVRPAAAHELDAAAPAPASRSKSA